MYLRCIYEFVICILCGEASELYSELCTAAYSNIDAMFLVENRLQKRAFRLPCLTQKQILSKLMFGFQFYSSLDTLLQKTLPRM